MNIEEEIDRAFDEWWNAPHPEDGIDLDLSAYIMPLVKRAQAEAGAKALREASWKYIAECRNPADVRDMMRAEAERIENEGAGAHD